MITNSILTNISKQLDGYRVTFHYEFDDGRVYNIKNIKVSDIETANILLSDRENEVMKLMISQDAKEAFDSGIVTQYKYASINDVFYHYLWEGYNIENPLDSYLMMSKVAPTILGLGLTLEQMSELFSTEIDVAEAVMNKWQYLYDNEQAILAYNNVVEGA